MRCFEWLLFALSLASDPKLAPGFSRAHLDIDRYWSEVIGGSATPDFRTLGEVFPDPMYAVREEQLRSFQLIQVRRPQTKPLVRWLPARRIRFTLPLPGPKPHHITVTMPKGHATPRGLSDIELARHLVLSLPFRTARATSEIELAPPASDQLDRGLEFATGNADSRGTIGLYTFTSKARPQAEVNCLLHEHGHNVGGYLFTPPRKRNVLLHPPFWEQVRAMEGGSYITPYAKEKDCLSEDFADSFKLHFLARGTEQFSSEHQLRAQALDVLYDPREFTRWRNVLPQQTH